MIFFPVFSYTKNKSILEIVYLQFSWGGIKLNDDEQEIIDAIESSIYMYQELEGVMVKYKHDFLTGHIWKDIDFEEYNQVGMSRLPDDQVENTIQNVIKTYTDLGLTRIGWFVSPQSKPDNLPEFLEKYGFRKDIPAWGMFRSMTDPLDISITDEFEFKDYTIQEAMKLFDDPEFCRMVELSYGLPEGSANVLRLLMKKKLTKLLLLVQLYMFPTPISLF